MKKISILLCLILVSLFKSKAQNISPSINNEYCPNTNIAFSVSGIPGTVNSATGFLSNCSVVSTTSLGNGYINFVGTFGDENSKKTFRINYTDANSNPQTYDFVFKKIKSLLYKNTAYTKNIINPTIPSITSPRCQITNHTISFDNIEFFTEFEIPTLPTFGSVTSYQYLLPVGWKLNNGGASDGVTWINGTNTAIVTSDQSNGVGGNVQIRGVNPCSPSLEKSAIKSIPINRPSPTLNIVGDNAICTSGFKTYTVSGLLQGANVTWSLSSTLNASIPNPSNGTSVNVTRVGTSYGAVVLTAVVTDCFTTYPAINFEIKLGAPDVLSQTPYWTQNGVTNYLQGCNQIVQDCGYVNPANKKVNSIEPNIVSQKYNFCATGYITDVTATNFSWSKVAGSGTHISWNGFGGNFNVEVNANFKNEWITLRCTSINPCGSAYRDYKFFVNPSNNVNCPYCPGCRIAAPPKQEETTTMSIFPNPSNGQFNVTLNSNNKAAVIKEVRVKNKIGALVYQKKFNSNQKTQPINISNKPLDMYLVEVFDGNTWQTQKFSLQK